MSLRLCCSALGDRHGKSAKGYREGGARGEVARVTAEVTKTANVETSSRFVTGTMAMTGGCAASTEPAVEQTGQMCEADGAVVRSAQKWNCAPRKSTPSSNAKMRMRRGLACMCLLRRSLGCIGCEVKKTNYCLGCFVSNQSVLSPV